MQTSGVRAVVGSFRAGPAARERTRALLQTNRPDIRYLVAHLVGRSTPAIARVCAAVLEEAGAPTATLGDDARIAGAPIDDVLYERAARLAISALHQLGVQGADIGEPVRREMEVVIALTAFAEASVRVALLVEEGPPDDPALTAPDPDIVIAGRLDLEDVDPVIALVPDGRPVVSADQQSDVRERIAAAASGRGLPLLLGGRDFSHEANAGHCDVTVAGERYARLPLPAGIEPWELAAGIAAALGIGALGIRMREDWIVAGVAGLVRASPQ